MFFMWLEKNVKQKKKYDFTGNRTRIAGMERIIPSMALTTRPCSHTASGQKYGSCVFVIMRNNDRTKKMNKIYVFYVCDNLSEKFSEFSELFFICIIGL